MNSGGPVAPVSEVGRPSSSFIHFLLGKFTRGQRKGVAKVAGIGEEPESRERDISKPSGVPLRSENPLNAKTQEDISSSPLIHTHSQVPSQNQPTDHELGSRKVNPRRARLQSVSEPCRASIDEEFGESDNEATTQTIVSRRENHPKFSPPPSSSTSVGWDFRKRTGLRRNCRSAQEWVRDSDVSASDWTNELRVYSLPDSNNQSVKGAEGLTSRSRSRSLGDVLPGTSDVSQNELQTVAPTDPLHKLLKASKNASKFELTDAQKPTSKRTSFEAGLAPRRSRESRRSAEKLRKSGLGDIVTNSDFLPVELRDRSLLFNTQNPE